MDDDRVEFAEKAKKQAVLMGQDKGLFKKAADCLIASDEYDYSYLWSWMGVPIIQLPADVMATQEVIWETKPNVIIETGVARGGSILMMASLLKLVGGGTVVGVDIDIRAHNRTSIESHPLYEDIVLIEGSSIDDDVLDQVKALIKPGDRVMVVLDSDHSRDHVLAELRAYAPLVTKGCFMIVADTFVGYLDPEQAPRKRSKIWLQGDEPLSAAREFLAEVDDFEVDEALNGKLILSSSPNGYLRRVK